MLVDVASDLLPEVVALLHCMRVTIRASSRISDLFQGYWSNAKGICSTASRGRDLVYLLDQDVFLAEALTGIVS